MAERRWDVAVVGLGPAGRALAHRLIRTGLSVLVIDPDPGRPWRQTLGGWSRQLPAWLPVEAVGARAQNPVIRAEASYPIRAGYAVLDNAALARALDLTGAELQERAASDLVNVPARVVVDARGAVPASSQRPRRLPLQRAIGVLVEPHLAAPVLAGDEAVLMDWRPFDGAPAWAATSPTFLYAIPMPDGRILLEETCLAGAPGPDHPELDRRLRVRLARHGIGGPGVDDAEIERVSIPMLRAPRGRGPNGQGVAGQGLSSQGLSGRDLVALDRGRPGVRFPGLGGHHQSARAGGSQVATGPLVVRFGAAGAQHNPITGYSAFASLAAVDNFVERITGAVREGSRLAVPGGPPLARHAALRALLRLSPDDTLALFDAFGRLPAQRQYDILDARATDRHLIAALTAQFRRLPPRSALALLRATTI
ncbi:lycopene beta-cyclase [Kineosphaera limosa]|nr:lycopene cyclase family protein [Kineosphaera limosa]NYE00643.1 lycopene beta-cyclase [Kineosphaera limosa]